MDGEARSFELDFRARLTLRTVCVCLIATPIVIVQLINGEGVYAEICCERLIWHTIRQIEPLYALMHLVHKNEEVPRGRSR